MTKKDYVRLATAIGQAYGECKTADECRGAAKVLEHIGHALQVDNPNFKPQVFVNAVKKSARLN